EQVDALRDFGQAATEAERVDGVVPVAGRATVATPLRHGDREVHAHVLGQHRDATVEGVRAVDSRAVGGNDPPAVRHGKEDADAKGFLLHEGTSRGWVMWSDAHAAAAMCGQASMTCAAVTTRPKRSRMFSMVAACRLGLYAPQQSSTSTQ